MPSPLWGWNSRLRVAGSPDWASQAPRAVTGASFKMGRRAEEWEARRTLAVGYLLFPSEHEGAYAEEPVHHSRRHWGL